MALPIAGPWVPLGPHGFARGATVVPLDARVSQRQCAFPLLNSNQDNSNPSDAAGSREQRRLIAEMTELVGGLAHELRNPLSTMMVNLKLLTEDLEDFADHPEDTRRRALRKVKVLEREAERLQTLFDKFLNLTATHGLQRASTDINAMVRGLVEFFEPSARDANVKVEVDLAAELPICNADEKLLRQALLNIVINGQQAMPDGGTLGITTEVDGDAVVIKVSDTGGGVAPEDRNRILRPFFSTKARGNGLGLSITQRIVGDHGGMLSFESNPSEGTTFIIRLPQSGTADGAERPPG